MAESVDLDASLLAKNCELVLPEDDFLKKLSKGKPLRIKLGMDPTAPDLHLGHTIVLSKLKQFQDLGHEIIFIIGDFTARIGDPSQRSKTRPQLSLEQIKQNAKSYFEQVGRILDVEKISVRYNSEWLAKLSLEDFLQVAGKVTLARIIERDDFQKRLVGNQPIGFHELFYPLLQGYDSVVLKADIELGGTDQTFNLLMGRHLQEDYEQEAQVIMTMPILEGLDGVKKMSKSLGNYIGLIEPPDEAYGKLMSVSDELMWRYHKLLLDKPEEELKGLRRQVKAGKVHPMVLKKEMAFGVVKKFWSEAEAVEAQKKFEALFQKRDYSQAKEVSFSESHDNPIWIVELLRNLGAIRASSEAKRLLVAKAIEIDGIVVDDFKANVSWKPGMVVKVGKHRIYKIK
ncbi:tyrosine--tRNA ligase [Candidatus Dependentiae bacterium]|nr:tyrosine--tRNA ligase [Candidatus Dependentiae bacterium]